jgi:hypothetical protein
MKKMFAILLGVLVLGAGGCVSMNIAGAGNLGDVNLGADVDPLNGNVGVNADKSIKLGDTETSVGAVTNGRDTGINTNTQYSGQ